MSDSYTVSGYEVLEKTVSPHGASGHIYLPKGGVNAIVKVIRTTPIGSDLATAPRHEPPHYDGVAGENLRAGDLVTVGDDGRVYRAGGPRP